MQDLWPQSFFQLPKSTEETKLFDVNLMLILTIKWYKSVSVQQVYKAELQYVDHEMMYGKNDRYVNRLFDRSVSKSVSHEITYNKGSEQHTGQY